MNTNMKMIVNKVLIDPMCQLERDMVIKEAYRAAEMGGYYSINVSCQDGNWYSTITIFYPEEQ